MSVYVTSTSRADHPSSLKGRKTNTVQAGCPPPFPWRTRITDEWMNKQSFWMRHVRRCCLSLLGEWMTTELFTRSMDERRRTPALRTQRNGEIDLWWKGRVQDEIFWMTIVERQRREEESTKARWMDERKYEGGQRFGREKWGSELWWRWRYRKK